MFIIVTKTLLCFGVFNICSCLKSRNKTHLAEDFNVREEPSVVSQNL